MTAAAKAPARAIRAMNRARNRIAPLLRPRLESSARRDLRPRVARCYAPRPRFSQGARARRGGRAVEGARLESVYTGNRIAGSNPAPSASSEHVHTGHMGDSLFLRHWVT